MNKLLIRLALIGAVGSLAVFATGAYFSDTESSVNNSLTAGKLDLLVNGVNDPGVIVTVSDLKPSIPQFETKTLKVIDNPANLYLHISNVGCNEGIETEPEEVEESTVQKCDFDTVTDYDLAVIQIEQLNASPAPTLLPTPAPIIMLSDTSTISDVTSCWIPLGTIQPGEVWTLEQSFHMQASTTNWPQGDVLTFNETFLARQTNDDTALPISDGITGIWNPSTKVCDALP